MYEPALNAAISIDQFWDSSVGEVLDLMESALRRRKSERKERAMLQVVLANQIAERVMGGKDRPTALWDYFPDLFETEKEQERVRQEEEELEEFKSKRRFMAAELERKRKAGEHTCK